MMLLIVDGRLIKMFGYYCINTVHLVYRLENIRA